MLLLAFVLKRSASMFISSSVRYVYYNTITRQLTQSESLMECDNFNFRDKKVFTLEDITVNVDYGGNCLDLVLSEYVDDDGKVVCFECADLSSVSIVVLPYEFVLNDCKMFKRSMLINYTFVNNKYLRRLPNAVVDKKSIDDLKKDKLSSDTFNDMYVSNLRELLKLRGMKLGGCCISKYKNNWGEDYNLKDEFWFKNASILRLTSFVDEETTLSYFTGDLFLYSSKCAPYDKDLRASGGKINLSGIRSDTYSFSKDIRRDLFKFYDYYNDFILDKFECEEYNNVKYVSAFLQCNLVTRRQHDYNSIYLEDVTNSDITYLGLFNLLSFKSNYKHFSKELQSVLEPIYSNIYDILKYECKNSVNTIISRSDIQKAINWCNKTLSEDNVSWKVM